MMKKIICIIFILILLSPVTVYADSTGDMQKGDTYDAQVNSIDTQNIEKFIDQLNRETESYLPPLNLKSFISMFKSEGGGYSLTGLLNGMLKYFFNDVLLNAKLLSQLVILSIICAILKNLENAFSSENISNLAYYACYLVLIIIIVKSFTLAVGIGRDTINKMVDFMTAMLPVLISLLTSVGGFASASIFDPLIMIMVQIISTAVKNIIIPLIFLNVILSIVNNISDTFQVTKLADLLKQIVKWGLGFMLTVFVGIITIRGTAVKSLDQVTVKTAKFAIDNFIPVVGKCLSDAISTIAGYSLVLKDAISTFGLIALVILCIFPLIKIITLVLIFKVTGALIQPISDKRIIECLNSVGDSLTLIFASVLCVAIMFFIMITVMASTGKMAVS
ncbi:MAG: stage III sporulation protein AE [Clostridiales bacterium]|nr:stage III sporulation protein AE [Clostridiales bacterium]HBM80155.1 stage III sporulation protein AE [Clostridiaceae bacterium]